MRVDRLRIFSLSVAIAGSAWLASAGLPSGCRAWWLQYVPKPLTTTLILAVAASSPRATARGKGGIVIGLVFSLVGDVFLMLPGDRFLAGLVSFLCAHVCYLAAFTADSPLAARRAPFLLWAAAGAAVLGVLWMDLPRELRLPVVLYAAVLMAMAAQATSRMLAIRTPLAAAAAIGAALFALSDILLSMARFRGPFPYAGELILGLYFTGQWLIALSVPGIGLAVHRPGRGSPRIVKT